MRTENAATYHRISQSLAERMKPLLPVYKQSLQGGRLRLPLSVETARGT